MGNVELDSFDFGNLEFGIELDSSGFDTFDFDKLGPDKLVLELDLPGFDILVLEQLVFVFLFVFYRRQRIYFTRCVYYGQAVKKNWFVWEIYYFGFIRIWLYGTGYNVDKNA